MAGSNVRKSVSNSIIKQLLTFVEVDMLFCRPRKSDIDRDGVQESRSISLFRGLQNNISTEIKVNNCFII